MRRYWVLFRLSLVVALAAALLVAQQRAEKSDARYFPPKDSWEARPPAELGLDPEKLQAAIQFSIDNQNKNTKNLAEDIVRYIDWENDIAAVVHWVSGANGFVTRLVESIK